MKKVNDQTQSVFSINDMSWNHLKKNLQINNLILRFFFKKSNRSPLFINQKKCHRLYNKAQILSTARWEEPV